MCFDSPEPIFELIEGEFDPWFKTPIDRQFDFGLCTESGCLGITLAFPESTGVLADLESGACQIAENVDFHQVVIDSK